MGSENYLSSRQILTNTLYYVLVCCQPSTTASLETVKNLSPPFTYNQRLRVTFRQQTILLIGTYFPHSFGRGSVLEFVLFVMV